MDTTARRDALIYWLRAVGPTTVEMAARRFDVSSRTIRRDLRLLRARGLAIDADPGRGGGIHLDATRSLPPIRLALEEVMGVLLAVTVTRGGPFQAAATRAARRLVTVLPGAHARAFRRLLSRVWIGPEASPEVRGTLGAVSPAVASAVEAAFREQRILRISYVDRLGQHTRRSVEVHGLLLQPPAWYLLCHDALRDAPRLFRMDRIARPHLTEATFRAQPVEAFAVLIDGAIQVQPLSGAPLKT